MKTINSSVEPFRPPFIRGDVLKRRAGALTGEPPAPCRVAVRRKRWARRLYADTPHRKSTGFTLIELLLYVSIVGGILMTLTGFFTLALESRIKNQTIVEVDQHGQAVLDSITQAIRNATSVTSPTTGTSGNSLTLAMPTAGVNPTIFNLSGGSTNMGYATDGGSTDSGDSNFMNATKFTAGASGTISTLYAFIGPTLGTSPNNKGQMAIFSGDDNGPITLLANSADVTLTASSWNAFPISSTSVTSGSIYWLAYNTNGTTATQNNLRYHTGTANQTKFAARTYGTWPATWSGGTFSNFEDSMYAPISTGGSAGAFQIKEGAGSTTPLTNDRVQITGLTFKNLSRSGTYGVVQVSFTISRLNPNNKNEYDYQKTFTGTAALR